MSNSQAIIANHNTRLNFIFLTTFLFGLVVSALLYSAPSFSDEVIVIHTLDEAFEFILADDRIPHANQVKLQAIHATYTDEMRVWKFTFIDGATTHIASVDKKARFKVDSTEDKEAYNEVFWADMPRAEGVFQKDWLYEAETFIQANHYSLTNPRILSYKVCEPPTGDIKSEFANGCSEEAFKQSWKIVSGVEGRKLAKMVLYGDGQLESFSNVTVELTQ
jgi:hypothetical protein